MPRRPRRVVEDLGLPRQLPGRGVNRVDVAVVAGIDDHVPVDRHVPVDGDEPGGRSQIRGIGRHLPAVLPVEIAGHRVHRLHMVVRVRHVQRAAVDQRRAFLVAGRQGAGPHQAQLVHVVPVDLVERAVTPSVQGASPHEPVARRRILQHGVGDGRKLGGLTRGGAGRRNETQDGENDGTHHSEDPSASTNPKPPARVENISHSPLWTPIGRLRHILIVRAKVSI